MRGEPSDISPSSGAYRATFPQGKAFPGGVGLGDLRKANLEGVNEQHEESKRRNSFEENNSLG